MGVFSWFRSKPSATVEASTDEAGTAAATAESPADGVTGSASGTEAPDGPAAALAEEARAEVTGSVESDAAAVEGVEIPKQQSAEEAADNEAGEGARK
ncbi:hypothetical protein [Streptomyces sp. NPDC002889]|uniref:hypothetical protein n=1 Tax=Streptomyces sp. NPDC002889 TaxID=3364669 RepID=UPI0036CC497D